MPKPTSKGAMALITQKLTVEQQVRDSIPTPPWAEKSPEHPRSPSTASEEDSATSEQNQSNAADAVSRELDIESEDNEDQGVSTEEESVPSDSEKATASEKPTKEKATKEKARVSEVLEPITLDELLKEGGSQERSACTSRTLFPSGIPKTY